MRTTSIAVCATSVGLAIGLVVAFGPGASSAAATHTVTFPIASFVPAAETTHNHQGSSVCALGFQQSQPTSENQGDLNAARGSFLHQVSLPQGAVVQRLTLWANDFDTSGDVHVYLVRKLLQAGLSPQFTGYHVMASAASSGAVLNTMRRFTDNSVQFATIDNVDYEYYFEVVNCAIVEPFAVQLTFAS